MADRVAPWGEMRVQQALPGSVLEATLERITFVSEETGYTVAGGSRAGR